MLWLLALLLHRRPRTHWAAAAAHRLGRRAARRRPQRVGRLRDGSRIRLDLRDHAQRHIYVYGESEPETTRLLRELVRPGATVLDVGANCGYYALLCAGLGATVHAFEPQAALAESVRASAALNGADVTVVEAAAGAEDGEIELYPSTDPEYGGMATVVPGYYTLSGPGRSVPVVRLDRWCRERGVVPAVIKIDVEGAEADVLSGLVETLRAHRPDVVCEVAFDRPHAERVLELVRGAGYEAFTIGADGLTPLDEPLARAGVANACFRPREQG